MHGLCGHASFVILYKYKKSREAEHAVTAAETESKTDNICKCIFCGKQFNILQAVNGASDGICKHTILFMCGGFPERTDYKIAAL
jgi:hypothetical protein